MGLPGLTENTVGGIVLIKLFDGLLVSVGFANQFTKLAEVFIY